VNVQREDRSLQQREGGMLFTERMLEGRGEGERVGCCEGARKEIVGGQGGGKYVLGGRKQGCEYHWILGGIEMRSIRKRQRGGDIGGSCV